MLYSPVFMPLLHGASGILDELLLICMPLVVVLIILAIASQRARQKAQPRERSARDTTSKPPHPPEA
jgi:ABC-type cobalt transport system substrate-binding protein